MSLSQEDLKLSQQAFRYYCSNSKKLTYEELLEALKGVGVLIPREIKKKKEKEFNDAKGDDKGWSLDDFIKIVYHYTQEEYNETQLLEAFRIFDGDGSGSIDRDELKYVMTTLGEKMTEEEVNELLNAADENKDGSIDYSEFVKVLMG